MIKKQRHTQAEMFGHIEACKQKAQPQKTYCKQHSLAYSTFQYWAQKYRKEISVKKATDTAPGFIPIKVRTAREELPKSANSNQLHFLYPTGIQLLCSETVNSEILKTLLNP